MSSMEPVIRQVLDGKEKFMPLLLIGDEQEAMIRTYLDRSDLFVMEAGEEPWAVCVVSKEGTGLYEVQNIAVTPQRQRRGYGRTLIEFVFAHYPNLVTLQLGTGDGPSAAGFYRALGFSEYKREKDYFLRWYDHPIYEEGQLLKDRICFRKAKAP